MLNQSTYHCRYLKTRSRCREWNHMDILLFTDDHLLTDVLRIALGGTYRVRWATTERRLFTTLAGNHVGAVVLDAGCSNAADLCARLHAFTDAALIAIARTDATDER